MSILLTLLKVIGITLLVILGLTLALLLILLLVPIRYRVAGARSAEDGSLTARGKVSWLASILAVTFAYDQEFSWKVRIFGIPLKMKKKDTSENEMEELTEEQLAEIASLEAELAEEDEANNQKTQENTPTTEPQLVLQTQQVSQGEADISNASDIPNASDKPDAVDLDTASAGEEQDATAEEKQKVPAGQKIKGFFQSLPDKMRSIRESLASIPDKIRSAKQQADVWIAFVKSDEVKLLIATCWKQLKQILRHLLPTKLRIQGNYGFADPSLTGKITGVLCAMPERYQKNIHLQPHFQEECLDGDCMLKGRIRLGSLLLPLIKIVVKPCTWKVYKRFKAITDPKGPGENGSQQKTSAKKSGAKKNSKISGRAGKNKKVKSNRSKNDPHKGGK